MSKTKVAIVNYLNTKPFLLGLQKEEFRDEFEIIECSPAKCADLFFDRKADISLVPVGSMAKQDFTLINSYGIASDGIVSSVCMFSDVPIEEIENVYLDYQSRTSVLLIQILFKEYWKKEVVYLESAPDFEAKISDKTAGLVIGDRALRGKSNYKYSYDLGECWKAMTKLPFVYAVWLGQEDLNQQVIELFNQAIVLGVAQKQEMIKSLDGYPLNLDVYFNQNIQFELKEKHLTGMQLFLSYAHDLENSTIPIPSFF